MRRFITTLLGVAMLSATAPGVAAAGSSYQLSAWCVDTADPDGQIFDFLSVTGSMAQVRQALREAIKAESIICSKENPMVLEISRVG